MHIKMISRIHIYLMIFLFSLEAITCQRTIWRASGSSHNLVKNKVLSFNNMNTGVQNAQGKNDTVEGQVNQSNGQIKFNNDDIEIKMIPTYLSPPTGLKEVNEAPAKPLLAISNFGLNLLKNIKIKSNAVISPFSIANSLSLLQQGAGGATQSQITMALRMLPTESAEAFKTFVDVLRYRDSSNILKIASNMFVDTKSFNLKPEFQNLALDYFASEVKTVDFHKLDETIKFINDWVAQHTENHIKDLVSRESVTRESQMVLANAVFFKGIWSKTFNPQLTNPKFFTLSSGTKKMVPFMRSIMTCDVGFDQQLNVQIVSLPFQGTHYGAMIILPSEGGDLDNVILNLDVSRLYGYQKLEKREVRLEIPKFHIKSDTNLGDLLQKVGITDMFSPKANFSGIGRSKKGFPKISSAVHSAVLSIDEKGATAAAATSFAAVALTSEDHTINFTADRPFVIILWDHQINIPLFIARIEDPSLR